MTELYYQDVTNRTTDENNNDHFSHSSLRHDVICERCGGTYLDETMFNHHSIKLHGSNLKPQTEIDNKHEHMAVIPCKIAEKGVEVKLGEEFTEHENLVLSKVTCDKCKTNLAPESALKLQNNMYHKDDKITSSRDMIRFTNKQYDQIKQNCQCSKRDLKSGNGSNVENHIICQSFNEKVLASVTTVYNKNKTIDEKEANTCVVADTEVIWMNIIDQSPEKSDPKEVKKSAIFVNAEIR